MGSDQPIPNRDVFALDPSGFNGFLFAVIGTEADGSRLTVLSALARLGEDPWAKAASWARMSKAAASDALAACIAQMPVSPEDLLAGPSTAARLVTLLSSPIAARPPAQGRSGPALDGEGRVMLIGLVCAAIILCAALLAFQ